MECRLCLNSESSVPIWDTPQSLVQCIWRCCQLQMEKCNGLPDTICIICKSNLELFIQFKNICKQSDEIIRNRLSRSSNFKVEVTHKNEIWTNEKDRVDIKVEQVILSDDDRTTDDRDDANKSFNVHDNPFLFKLLSQNTKTSNDEVTIIEDDTTYCKKKRFKCKICSKAFMYRSHLKRHMIIHAGNKPFKCDICTKQFALKYNISQHMKIHIGDRPFKCELCPAAFIQKCDLRHHMKIHTGERLNKCNICSKSFVHKCSLVRHLLIHNREKL
ncbi:uncharacterized protein LOC143920745 isoform X1 [Arctopsyche grandis]|uniref:uncharacterized protein LOC143920745 isoform X1 n=1 Tax=Arctopsyche grandis TaxID=121162 RepID=UPI00406D6F02